MQPLRVTAMVFLLAAPLMAQQSGPATAKAEARPRGVESPAAVTPPGYVIGPEDVLTILFWHDKEMSGEFIVRPDGKISTPLLNDVQAAGLTPEELRVRFNEEASELIEDPNATVVVKQINSRKVFITGEIEKPGAYSLTGPMTVLQLVANAGGFKEYAKRDHIVIMRTESGRQTQLKFNYNEVVSGKKLQQNVELKPGDTVVVP